MHVNDLGSWCVAWIRDLKIAHAFFAERNTAVKFRNEVGGELYLKHPDGSLKRADG